MIPRLAKILIATTALAILSQPACAGANNGAGPDASMPAATSGTAASGSSDAATGSTILNGQVTFGSQWSTVNATIKNVGGDVVVQSQGAGNVLEAVTFDDTHVTSTQDAESDNIGSTINTNVNGVGGSVSVTGIAVCNSTDVSTDPNVTAVDSTQTCNAKDPGSEINGTIKNVYGDVAVNSAAYGNQYTEDTNALNAPTHIVQNNTSNVFGTTNIGIQNVQGSVGVSASAIGNNAQIVHYSTAGSTSGTGQ